MITYNRVKQLSLDSNHSREKIIPTNLDWVGYSKLISELANPIEEHLVSHIDKIA